MSIPDYNLYVREVCASCSKLRFTKISFRVKFLFFFLYQILQKFDFCVNFSSRPIWAPLVALIATWLSSIKFEPLHLSLILLSSHYVCLIFLIECVSLLAVPNFISRFFFFFFCIFFFFFFFFFFLMAAIAYSFMLNGLCC